MTEEEMRAAVAKAQLEAAQLKTQLAEKDAESIKLKSDAEKLKAENTEKEKAIAEQAKVVKAEKVKMAREAVTAVLEAGVRTKKILPADRERFAKLLKVDNDDAVLAIDIKDVESLAKISQVDAVKIMASGASAFSRDPGKGEGESAMNDPGEDHTLVTDLYTISLKRSRDDKIDIFSAMEKVVREDPKLGQRFLAYVFENDQAA